MVVQNLFVHNQWVVPLIVVWVLPWKGVALWKAAQLKDRWWFISLLVLNTLAVLEIFYIFIFSKRKNLKTKQQKLPLPN